MTNFHFRGSRLDRRSVFMVATSGFEILTLVSFLYFARIIFFARSGRDTFTGNRDPLIAEFRGLPEGRLWCLPETVWEVIDEFEFFSIFRVGENSILSKHTARTFFPSTLIWKDEQ